MTKRAALIPVALALLAAGAGAWWMLVTPDNPVTQLFRRKITDVDTRVVLGPYPGERDFRLLKQNNVGLVISLLDPAIPYEATLLEREKAVAQQVGIKLLNFPMSSILGRKFGNYYDESASKAASAIEASADKVYLHCYLGVHRIKVVQELLAARGVNTGKYVVREPERNAAAKTMDAADAAFRSRQFQAALDALAGIDENQLNENGRLLRAWATFRLGRIKEARELFAAFLALSPGHADATVGLAYCEYRQGAFAEAERLFRAAVDKRPTDSDALGGLGLTLLGMDRRPEAAVQIEAALKISPDNQELRDALKRAQAPR